MAVDLVSFKALQASMKFLAASITDRFSQKLDVDGVAADAHLINGKPLHDAVVDVQALVTRQMAFTGDVQGSGTMSGAGDFTLQLLMPNVVGLVPGTYPVVTINGKGQVVGARTLKATDIPDLDAAKIATGTIAKARLTGNYDINVTGSAATAGAWSTGRKITAAGAVTGNVTLDGSQDVTLNLALPDIANLVAGSYAKVQINTKGQVVGTASLVAGDIPALDAGKITSGTLAKALLSGTYDLSITGNAATATAAAKWSTGRKLTLSGDLAGNVTFDGSVDFSLAATLASIVAAGKGTKITYNAKGLVTGSESLVVGDLPFAPVQQGGGTNQGNSKVMIGWMGSTLGLTIDATDFGSTWPINVNGSSATAGTAAKWATSRTFTFQGDIAGTLTTDGSSNTTVNMVLPNVMTAGTYAKVTVNTKGLVVGSAALTASDVNTALGYTAANDANLKSMGRRNVFISTAAPTAADGADGDIWLQIS